MLTSSLSIIAVGFGLGLLHAFDADHVMAVSTLSSERPGMARTLRFCASWAIGHAGVLVLTGLLLFGLGVALPAALVEGAEAGVGVVLMVMGAWCLWQLRLQRAELTTHAHPRPGQPGHAVHTHWHHRNHPQQPLTEGAHRPLLVGILHGLAGSAPALALVPVLVKGQLILALGYLLLFSLGVLLAMLSFGLLLNQIQQQLKHYSQSVFEVLRYLTASGAMVLGGVWLVQAL